MGLTVERRRTLSPAEWAAFRAIYERSFPAPERDETGGLIACIEAGERICDLALVDGDVVGLAVTKKLSVPGTAALEYLAVDPARRGEGIGSLMLAHIRQALAADVPGAHGFLFEVDPPLAADGGEREIRRRRIRFYERNGAAVVESVPAFRAPSMDGAESVAYVLMWLPAGDATEVPQGSLLQELVAALLIQSYDLDPSDPLVGEVLGDLPRP